MVYGPNLSKPTANYLHYYKEKAICNSPRICHYNLLFSRKGNTFTTMSTVQPGQKADSDCLKSAENSPCLYVSFGKC